MITWIFVAARIIANPVSNVLQKRLTQRSSDPLFIIAATHAFLAVACLPLLFGPLHLTGGIDLWANIVTAGLLAVAGNSLLVHALKTSDLSVLGPINAYKSVVGMILGIFLVHEVPTLRGILGVFLVVAGSYFIVDKNNAAPRRNAYAQFFRERGVQLRLGALGLAATEAVFLKRALLASSPATVFVLWCILGLPIAAVAVVVLLRERMKEETRILGREWSAYLWLAATTGVMQGATIFTFGQLQVGYSLALFQLSTLISVFFGYRYFQERNIKKRLIGSLIMLIGAALITVFG